MKELDMFLKGKLLAYNYEKYGGRSYSLARVLYGDDFYFIYSGDLDGVNIYKNSLDFLGIFDNKTDEIYLESNYYNILTESDYNQKLLDDVFKEMEDKVSYCYTEYIDKNKESIKESAKLIYNKYYSYKENVDYTLNKAKELYINDNFVEKIKLSNFPSEIKTIKGLSSYIRNGEEFINNLVIKIMTSDDIVRIGSNVSGISDIETTRANSVGFRLLENDRIKSIIQEIDDGILDDSKDLKKLRNINKVVKDNQSNIKNVIISIIYNNNELEFSYNFQSLLYMQLNSYHVESSKRIEFDRIFEDTRWGDNNKRILAIKTIKYRGKILYEDEEL